MARFGNTHVLCTASVEDRVPSFLRNSGRGWVTAEYGMLPRSTHSRSDREASRGKQGGRTLEIQRLIGRALRSVTDLEALGEHQIKLDCDVIQADGGTRTTAINGACIALIEALQYCQREKLITDEPFLHFVSAISVGVYQQQPVCDLDYAEDSQADTDMNVVMANDNFIEVQGTAEAAPFSRDELNALLDLAADACLHIQTLQKNAILA